MSFLDKIIALDKSVLIYLNNLGSPNWDGFWLSITHQFNWIPLFILMLFLIFKVYGLKKGLIILLIAAVLVTFTDQFVNLIKHTFERLRPNNDPSVKGLIRLVYQPRSFSFVSGHATNSMANTVFIYLLLKKHFKYAWLFFIWPLVFAYSRVYLGVHYPVDILTGALLGMALGFGFYKISLLVLGKLKPSN
ncbi:MAG: phosphatase PAP2 family protein [Flavobacteriales bacterium]|jgi:undecaprenyl-diphosphatase|nr:phosphatase PAP2 family protein [Flavobacteriales bacterium]